MEDCRVRSAATILASVREQEARFEQLTRALEHERRHVALQLERAQQPGTGGGQSLPIAWQQLVLQVLAPGLGPERRQSRDPGGPQACRQRLILRPSGASGGKGSGIPAPLGVQDIM